MSDENDIPKEEDPEEQASDGDISDDTSAAAADEDSAAIENDMFAPEEEAGADTDNVAETEIDAAADEVLAETSDEPADEELLHDAQDEAQSFDTDEDVSMQNDKPEQVDDDAGDEGDEIVLGRDDLAPVSRGRRTKATRDHRASTRKSGAKKPEKLSAPRKSEFDVEAAARPAREGEALFPLLVRLAGVGFAIAAFGVIAAAAFAGWYLNQLSQDLPDYQVLAEYAPPVTTRVYAGDGSLVAEFARERRLFVPIENIPEHVKAAFVSTEDKTFYEHTGIDMRGIARAQVSNVGNILSGRRLEGGSTITQQVAKNFLLSSEQRIDRKLKEMLIARKMETAFTKGHILELYLNEIYLGNRSYGVAAAALNYFDKALDELTIGEAAYLAGLAKGPSNYHPVANEDAAVSRRNLVIRRMLAAGGISEEQADEASAQPLGAVIAPPLGAREWTMEYFAEEVRKQIVDLYGVEALYDGGLAVRTSVDPRLQRAAGDALRRWLTTYDLRHGWRGPLGLIGADDEADTPPDTASDELTDDADDATEAGDAEEHWTETFATKLKALRRARIVSDDLAPWRPALVLDVETEGATIGFEDGSEGTIPLAQLLWAREYISANEMGEEITSAADVLSPGEIVYVVQASLAVVDAVPVADEDAETSPPAPAPNAYALRQPPGVNGGLIAIDPHTGRVLAMVGGFSFQLSEFNRAVQAERQPGSTFKPFVYSVALDSGYTPASTVLDAPFVAPSVDSWYKPGNYISGRYYGNSTLRLGVEQSRNTMTARLAQDLGIGRIMEYIERFQLSDRLPRELAISLGSGETTLMRITAAYSIFVNGGKRVDPLLIDRIQDRTGKTIYKRDARACFTCDARVWSGQTEPQLSDARAQVLDPRTAYQVTSILEGVVVRGTGSAVRRVSNRRPLAGKTGTTNDYKDAWFVGFSPDLAAGVYVGFDMPQTLGQGEAGGKVAAPIFADFMNQALKDEAAIPFRVPSGIRLVRVNAKTGRPATSSDRNVILEAFKADDIIGGGISSEEELLDPLSAAPRPPTEYITEPESIDGLY
jgi:penicillin-binding protein 1A